MTAACLLTMRGLFFALVLLSPFLHLPASAGMLWQTTRDTHDVAPIQAEKTLNISNVSNSIQRVLDEIVNIDRMPTCSRIAAKDLADSCIAFDGTRTTASRGTDVVLEEFRNIFALRRTWCEFEAAAQRLPGSCDVLLSEGTPARVVQMYMQSCLSDLTYDSNHWSTFQSMKQDGLILCSAMRAEKDKDEALQFYKILAQSVLNVNDALEHHRDSFNKLRMEFKEVCNGISAFHRELHDGQKAIRADILKTSEDAQKHLSDINGGVQDLSLELGHITRSFQDFLHDIDSAFRQQSQALSAHADDRGQAALDTFQDTLLAYRDKVEYELEVLSSRYHNKVNTMTDSVDVANDLTSQLNIKLGIFADGLDFEMARIGQLKRETSDFQEKQQRTFVEIQFISNQTVETLNVINEQTSHFQNSLGPITTSIEIFASLFGRTWLFVTAFAGWSVLIAGMVLKICWGFLSFSVALPLACATSLVLSAMLAAYANPVHVAHDIIASHPIFFATAPSYVSAVILVLIGVLAGVLISIGAKMLVGEPRSKEYDPTAPIDYVREFKDDIDTGGAYFR